MFKNYFRIAGRVLLRNKVYVALNVAGLGFALACCLLAYLNYDYHARFDANFPRTEKVYRINSLRTVDGAVQEWAVTPSALGFALMNQSGIQNVAQLTASPYVVRNGEALFSEKVFFADAAFFQLFHFPMLYGNLKTFDQKNALLISEGYAKKYFNRADVVGKQLTLVNNAGADETFTITAVLATVPANSSFQMDLVTSATHASFGNSRNDWRSGSLVSTFAELPDPIALATLEKSLQSYAALHNEAQPTWRIERFSFQPFKNIAKSSDRDMAGYVHGRELNSNPRGVIVIGPAVLSLFLLLIACFNFTNISIAFAGGRLKEIGIRKVMGGLRMQLVKQFLAENVILCIIASLLACFFVIFLLPAFNALLGLQLQMHLGDYTLWLLLLAMPLVTAVVSGLYPALYISGFEPVAILKGQRMFGSSNWLNRLLLVLQFALSCMALVLGIALSKNAAYQKRVDYGYSIQEVAVAQVGSASEYQTLANALAGNPKIKRIAGTVHQVGEGATETMVKNGNAEAKVLYAKIGGKAYLETMGITLLQGRHFHAGASLDETQSLIVNQTFAEQLQLNDPVGKTVWMDSAYRTIVGVVKDYKEYGQHGRVPPIAMLPAPAEAYQYLVLQTNRASLNGVYKEMQDTWHRLLPGKPFNGFLQRELIDKEVYMNAGFESVAYFLALSTIMLSASGVFALVSLNIIRRRKEIGMRKILGASIMQLILIINKDFMRVLFIAFIIGSALGFLIIDKIVFRYIYVYHPDIGVSVFLLTLLILLLSGALTIGMKVFSAASANPVNSLRTE